MSLRRFAMALSTHSTEEQPESLGEILPILGLALPDDKRLPPGCSQSLQLAFIPKLVFFELRMPEIHVRAWHGRLPTSEVLMPKASMYEHDFSPAREG